MNTFRHVFPAIIAAAVVALGLRESERPLRQMIEGWRAPRTVMVHVGDNPSRLAWMQEAVPAGVTIVAVKDKEEALGTQVAENAHGMGMRIIATRGSSREGPDFVDYVGLADELPALIGQADVVVNVTPLTPQTTGLFDSAMFGCVQKREQLRRFVAGDKILSMVDLKRGY